MNGTNLDSLLCPLPGFIWKSDLIGNRSIFSVGWSEYTGFNCKSLTDDWLCFVHPYDVSTIEDAYQNSCLEGMSFRIQYRIKDVNGEYRWFLDCGNPCHDRKGRLIGFAGVSTDIHELKMETMLDKLTGLNNYAFFSSYLEKQVTKRSRTSTALISVDLNNLKSVNDSMGHGSGNELIIAAANILKHAFRGEDAVCRVGGDEFEIILVDIEETDVLKVKRSLRNKCRSLKRAINAYNKASGKPFVLDMALGYSIYEGQGIAKLVNEADKAMYRDKRRSKSRRLA